MLGKLITPNIGRFDRFMRLLGGIAVLYILHRSRFHSHSGIYVMRGFAAIALLSALTGYSILYQLFKFSTVVDTNADPKGEEEDYWNDFVSSTPKVRTRTPLDFSFPEDKKKPLATRPKRAPPPHRYELEKEIPKNKINELIELLEHNQLDEILLLRVYEKIYSCEITIIPAHINTYLCDFGKNTQLLDYATMHSDLLSALKKQS
jgi:Protein of unknown function (DUF2892)